jgi:hypothetical protein
MLVVIKHSSNVYLHRHPRITFYLTTNTWQEEMQETSKASGRLQTFKAALRGWFIKIGLEPPPIDLNSKEKQLSREQEQAQMDLHIHQQRKPRYW